MRRKKIILISAAVLCLITLSKAADNAEKNDDPNILQSRQEPYVSWLEEDISEQTPPDHPDLIKRFVYVVILVIGLGTGAYYFSKKLVPGFAKATGKYVSVVETVSLAPNRMIHLVQAGGRRLLISSTPQAINLLAEIDKTSENPNEFQDQAD